MNSLNSVLIEGSLKTNPELSVVDKTRTCIMTIDSTRYVKNDEKYDTEITEVSIIAVDTLADVCMRSINVGRGIRVIGRLAQVDDKLIVAADLVEFRPVEK